MLLKTLLALALVTAAAAGWKLATSEPTAPPEPVRESAPSWIEDPASFFDVERPDLILAVGSARIFGGEQQARRVATIKARANLVRARGALGGTTKSVSTISTPGLGTSRTVTSTSSTTTTTTTVVGRERFSQERTAGISSGAGEVASWVSAEGVLWVLLSEAR